MTTTENETHDNARPALHWEGDRAPLAKALVQVAAEIPAVGRDKANPLLHNKYVTLDALRETVTPILAAHGLCVMQVSTPTLDRSVSIAATQKVAERVGVAGVVVVCTTVLHESGACVWFETRVPWQEAAGITTAQAVGIGMTYGERYAFRGFFSVAATDDTDTDGAAVDNRHRGPSEEDVKALQSWFERWEGIQSGADYKAAVEDWKVAPDVVKGDAEVKAAMLGAHKRLEDARAARKAAKTDTASNDQPPAPDGKAGEYVTLFKSVTTRALYDKLSVNLAKEAEAVKLNKAVLEAQDEARIRTAG